MAGRGTVADVAALDFVGYSRAQWRTFGRAFKLVGRWSPRPSRRWRRGGRRSRRALAGYAALARTLAGAVARCRARGRARVHARRAHWSTGRSTRSSFAVGAIGRSGAALAAGDPSVRAMALRRRAALLHRGTRTRTRSRDRRRPSSIWPNRRWSGLWPHGPFGRWSVDTVLLDSFARSSDIVTVSYEVAPRAHRWQKGRRVRIAVAAHRTRSWSVRGPGVPGRVRATTHRF